VNNVAATVSLQREEIFTYLSVVLQQQQLDASNRRLYSHMPLTLEMLRERVMLVLRLYDKVDPEKARALVHSLSQSV